MTQAFLKVSTWGGLMANMFVIAILPAIGEELAFRGVLQRIFFGWSRNRHVAIMVTAAIFSLMHFQFYGFVPRFLMGVAMGYMLDWSGSIWVPVLAHFFNNGTSVLLSFLKERNALGFDPDQWGVSGIADPFLIIGIILTAILFYVMHKTKAEDALSQTSSTIVDDANQ
jgi:membrane protease YdiL (CAAX protease family)